MHAGIDLPREYELSQTASSNEKSTDRQLSASGFQCSSKPPHEGAILLECTTFSCGSGRGAADDFACAVEITIVLLVIVAGTSGGALGLRRIGLESCEEIALIQTTNRVRNIVQLGINGDSNFAEADNHTDDENGEDENEFSADDGAVFIVEQVTKHV